MDKRSITKESLALAVGPAVYLAPMRKKNGRRYDRWRSVIARAVEMRTRVQDLVGPATRFAASIAGLIVIIVGVRTVGDTSSYFSDYEASVGNFLEADPLAFTLSLSPAQRVDLTSGSATATVTIVPDPTSEPIAYGLSARIVDPNEDFCNAIRLTSGEPLAFDGHIGFLQTLVTTSTDPIPLEFFIDPAIAATGTACAIEMLATGRNADAPEGSGYSHSSSLTIQIFRAEGDGGAIPAMRSLEAAIQSPESSGGQNETSGDTASTSDATEVPQEPGIDDIPAIEGESAPSSSEPPSEPSAQAPNQGVAPDTVVPSDAMQSGSVDEVVANDGLVPEPPQGEVQSQSGQPAY